MKTGENDMKLFEEYPYLECDGIVLKKMTEQDAPVANQYERCELTAENAAAIPCEQVLGAYIVRFTRRPKK